MNYLIRDCIEFLEIKRPVSVALQTKIKNPDWFAYHTAIIDDSGKVLKHIIKITLEDQDKYDLQTIVAHELVHAWQLEYNIKGRQHGKRFQKKAIELKQYLEYNGYLIHDIYRSDIDVT